MQAWNVYRNGKWYSRVYFSSSITREEVTRSLIDHDYYPSDISLRRCNKYRRN